jgi:hypothetical protein
VLFRALTEGGAAVARRFPAFFVRMSLSVSALAADAGVVRLPAGVGRRVERIWRRTADGRSLMEMVSQSYLTELFPPGVANSAPPGYWCWTADDGRSIWVRPTPDVDYVLSVESPSAPTPLRRLCSNTSYSATATYGSKAVTLSGSVPEGAIEPGDEFGVCPAADQSGTALSDVLPVVWGEVEAVTASEGSLTGLTLREAFAEPSAEDILFVAAQVWDGERLHPGIFGRLLVYLALAALFEFRDPDQHAVALKLVELASARLVVDGDSGGDVGGWRPGEALPWMGGAR